MERADPLQLLPETARRPRALVADDDPVGRIALRKLLATCGYDALLTKNGAEAVESFRTEHIDIVFMDMLMPVMDGPEAVRQIKQLCGERFVPVIFVTGNSDDEDMVRCTDAGGDAFLVKPFSTNVLGAKIRAMERIRALHERSSALQARMDDEQRLAKTILEGAVMGGNVHPAALHVHLSPATTFNGDLLLSAYSPSGNLHVLLGDFTGHGLAATIGALPAAETFRAMTAKGFAPARIMAEINRKLRALLPTGIFLSAAIACIDAALGRVSIINAGMPDVCLIRKGRVDAMFCSTCLPLAVVAESDYEAGLITIPVAIGDRLVLVSDGAIEATNPAGEMLGAERLRAAFTGDPAEGGFIAAAVREIERFSENRAQADDVSLVDIHLIKALFPETDAVEAGAQCVLTGLEDVPTAPASESGWRLTLELRGHALRETSTVPLLISTVHELPGLSGRSPELFTVLAELYNNALDHGALQLDSRLKENDFATYLHARETRLESPGAARVAIQVDCAACANCTRLEILVEDSGTGFDPDLLPVASGDAPYGRGIHLVRNLCESLQYEGGGQRARAIYSCSSENAEEP